VRNLDAATVAGFGDEWTRYDQSGLPVAEATSLFNAYFAVFPWDRLPGNASGFDLGCGSGRWARLVAPRVGRLHCVDPSGEALAVARRNLASQGNCEFHTVTADELPFADASMDFAYSLGVLHHVPDPAGALAHAVSKLKPGAPFLLYLYYALENRPLAFRLLFYTSDVLRHGISRLPHPLRNGFCQLIALLVYWPLARLAALAERLGIPVTHWPLAFYRRLSFYTMQTDALDRFGTRLTARFTAAQIESLMRAAGLGDIVFSPTAPYWCAVGHRGARDCE
jgi:SAM-dependent methyltransferase